MTSTNYVKTQPSKLVGWLLASAAFTLLVLLLAGCYSTVAPKTPAAAVYSWDAGEQNSGVLDVVDYVTPAGKTNTVVIVTPYWRERFNSFVPVYGVTNVYPPLVKDYGITVTSSNTFLATPQAFAAFAEMNRKYKKDHAR